MIGSNYAHTLVISCPDKVGIVAQISGFLQENDAFITEAAQYGDPDTKRFFMRVMFQLGEKAPTLPILQEKFVRIANHFAMDWKMHDGSHRPKVLIMVSKFGHCLNDLLHRWQSKELAVDIPAVVSNHPDMGALVKWHGIPYHHLPVTKENKQEQEERLLQMVEGLDVDLVVLARYMQVLSPAACRALKGRCINIHHSFLPSFMGAKPYHQAHTRGVKLIGATAHYVTEDLDEGPIIEQAVDRVDHTQTPKTLVRLGADLENFVLARAVRYHLEHRVLLNGNKTVVFK
jgi:formyltetrahydrofolate deformylase